MAEFAELPSLYAGWVREFLGGDLPRETKATCQDCAMCAPAQGPVVAVQPDHFDPEVKCCTFWPRLPNFLVGRILSDGGEGATRVLERLRIEEGVTPLGVDSPAIYDLLYNSRALGAFGRTEALRCPYYVTNDGSCSIWRNRNGVCATWHCKHVRGNVGWRAWQSLSRLLHAIEHGLSHWCALELGLSESSWRELLAPVEEGGRTQVNGPGGSPLPLPPQAHTLWGSWDGRGSEFFKRCAELVAPLSWPEVLATCGPVVAARAVVARADCARLVSTELPQRLRAGRISIMDQDASSCRIVTYSALDPQRLTRSVMAILPYFDGRPLSEVRSVLESELNVGVSDDLLRRLVDFQILVSAEPAVPGPQR